MTSAATLYRRAMYGGRKGRRAARRLRSTRYVVTLAMPSSMAWQVWKELVEAADREASRLCFGGSHT